MKKIIYLVLTILFFLQIAIAEEIKLYDNLGNRIGTYKKEGNNFILYDFYDNRIDSPEQFIENAPTQSELKDIYMLTKNSQNLKYSNFGILNPYRYDIYSSGFIEPECWFKNNDYSIIRVRK